MATSGSTAIDQIIGDSQAGIDPEEKFRLLFESYYWPTFRLLSGRGFTPDECEDLTQESFLHVYRTIGDFRGDGRFDHWLFRIVINTANKYLRARKALKRGGPEGGRNHTSDLLDQKTRSSDSAGSPTPLATTLERERSRLLHEAISDLPGQMRRCVRLRIFHGLLYAEIAEVLLVAEPTVKVQLFKARKRLREHLGDYYHDPPAVTPPPSVNLAHR